ncbi:MAG: DNA polymerase III subunit delta [Armatimonadota bacterium]|nr:MAG: DNA polymerase III subunit delta [Armatimonadota bacterium]
MTISATEFLSKGIGKAPARVYLVHGREEGQKNTVLQRLRDELVADEFDRAHLDAQEVDLFTILAESMSIPAFSPRRVVFVRGVQHLKSADIDSLAEAIPRLPESTCLILYTHAESEEEDRKGAAVPAKLLSAVQKQGVVVECKPLSAASFGGWLEARLREAGKEMTPDAKERLTFLTAASIAAAEPELQKLVLYVGERSLIEREDVEAVVSRTVEAQVFKLVDAIVTRDAASAMRLLQDVLSSGGRAEAVVPRLMVLIARQFRLLWQMRLQIEYGEPASQWFPSDPNLTQLLSRQPFLKRNLSEQAQRLSLKVLKTAFDRLHQADRLLKGIDEGDNDPRRIIERLVVDLCGVK